MTNVGGLRTLQYTTKVVHMRNKYHSSCCDPSTSVVILNSHNEVKLC